MTQSLGTLNTFFYANIRIISLRYFQMFLVVFVVGLTAGDAYAFKFSPAFEQDLESLRSKVSMPKYASVLDHLTRPIHENITKMTYICATVKKDGEPCSGFDDNLPAPHFTGRGDLIHGSRWVDDPNNSFLSDGGITWAFWMYDAQKKVKKIDRIYALLYRSHYGDLQFLHAMASTKDSHEQTRVKILDWGRFAYEVATGEIATTATLGDLAKKNYAFAKNFDYPKNNWTVRHLFLNIGDFKFGGKLHLPFISDEEIRLIALGALLHTVQDSYSHSHVTRTKQSTTDSSQSGGVKAFLDYTQQNADCHGHADFGDDWLSKESADATDNPVYHGAWIIRHVQESVLDKEKKSWSAIANRFALIFEIADEDAKKFPGDGGFKKCT